MEKLYNLGSKENQKRLRNISLIEIVILFALSIFCSKSVVIYIALCICALEIIKMISKDLYENYLLEELDAKMVLESIKNNKSLQEFIWCWMICWPIVILSKLICLKILACLGIVFADKILKVIR